MELMDFVKGIGVGGPVGTMVDPRETLRFLEFLPDVEWFQGYVVLLLIRSKNLKEKYGFKGSDRSLSLHVVPGYYDNPKFKLYMVLRRYAVLHEFSSELYVYERHVGDGIEYYRIPTELVALRVSPNPTDWVRAEVDTINEVVLSLRDAVFNPGRADDIVRRIDVQFCANAMKHTRHVFHMIDVDEWSIVKDVETYVQELLGYMPARIVTKNGEHLLIKVSSFDRDTAKRWFGHIRDYVNEVNEVYGEEVVEYKKNFQEPVPGVKYCDIVPRFYPSER